MVLDAPRWKWVLDLLGSVVSDGKHTWLSVILYRGDRGKLIRYSIFVIFV